MEIKKIIINNQSWIPLLKGEPSLISWLSFYFFLFLERTTRTTGSLRSWSNIHMNTVLLVGDVPAAVASCLLLKLRRTEISAKRGQTRPRPLHGVVFISTNCLRATHSVITDKRSDLYYNPASRGRFHHILFMAAASARQPRRAQTEDASHRDFRVRFVEAAP